MRLLIKLISACFIAVLLSGCATLITGSHQKIPVSSEPGGATVQVDGKETYATPAKIRLKRNADHQLVFTKEGYVQETVKLAHVISGAFCGNVFLGGPVGMGLDAMSGAQFKLVPTKVHVELKKKE
jgi:uncharacterized protein YceK